MDLPALRFVQTLYTGVDGFPFDRVPSEAMVAGNVGAYAPFVAEHALALLLALARYLPEGHAQVLRRSLRPTRALTYLGGKRALIVGYGEIGHAIADRLRPFGTVPVGMNRSGTARPGVEEMRPISELLSGLRSADFVFNCLPLTRETQGQFDRAAFAAMGPQAIFVNVGRGETVDSQALQEKLEREPEFRAGLDVWWGEDMGGGVWESDFPAQKFPNLLGSPHRAGFVPEALPVVLDQALQNIARFCRGEAPRNVADRLEYRF
jgi:glycerate dehydrogenase